MGLPQGCCCWDLPQGSMAVGIFFLVAAIIETCFGLLAIGYYDTFINLVKKQAGDQVDFSYVDRVVYGTLIAYILLGVIYIMICSLLIHGCRKENRCLMLPWIVLTSLQLVLSVVMLIMMAVAGQGTTVSIVGLVIGLVVVGFFLYMLLVIISYYKRLKDAEMYRAINTEMSGK